MYSLLTFAILCSDAYKCTLEKNFSDRFKFFE